MLNTQCYILHNLLSLICALTSVKFLGLKLRLCKHNDKYEVYVWVKTDNWHLDLQLVVNNSWTLAGGFFCCFEVIRFVLRAQNSILRGILRIRHTKMLQFIPALSISQIDDQTKLNWRLTTMRKAQNFTLNITNTVTQITEKEWSQKSRASEAWVIGASDEVMTSLRRAGSHSTSYFVLGLVPLEMLASTQTIDSYSRTSAGPLFVLGSGCPLARCMRMMQHFTFQQHVLMFSSAMCWNNQD